MVTRIKLELEGRLSEEERKIALPIFQIPDERLEPAKCRIVAENDFIRSTFVAINDAHCSFELHWGRGTNNGRYNLYVGRGAEFWNLETADSELNRKQLAEDVGNFLQSTVTCTETVAANGTVRRARYCPSKVSVNGQPLVLSYSLFPGWRAFLIRNGERTFERRYAPWVDGNP